MTDERANEESDKKRVKTVLVILKIKLKSFILNT